jgi:hypothetical protein
VDRRLKVAQNVAQLAETRRDFVLLLRCFQDDAAGASEMAVTVNETSRRKIQNASDLHTHCRENLSSLTVVVTNHLTFRVTTPLTLVITNRLTHVTAAHMTTFAVAYVTHVINSCDACN